MPNVSTFYGIVICMYYFDDRRHNLPHVHARCQRQEAVFSIPDGKLLAGSIPAAKTKLVEAWIEIRKEELMAAWDMAVKGRVPYPVDPLR